MRKNCPDCISRKPTQKSRGTVVYLAGPINGIKDSEVFGWRRVAAEALKEHDPNIEVLDPTRRDFRGLEATSEREIVEGDLDDIRKSTILLAYTPRPSHGTSMEIFFAKHVVGITVITACPWPNEKTSPWVHYHSNVVVSNPAAGVKIIKSMHDQQLRGE